MRCAAVLLCGGSSSRMGTPKEILRGPAGKTLLETQIDRLRNAGFSPLALAGDRKVQGVDLPRWPDEPGIEGPFAAFPSIFRNVVEGHVLILSVDLGAMDEDFLRRLRERARPGRMVAPVDGEGRWESTCCLWSAPLLDEVTAWLRSGGRSIRGFLNLLEPRVDPFPIDASDAPRFANWNAPSDLPSGWRIPS